MSQDARPMMQRLGLWLALLTLLVIVFLTGLSMGYVIAKLLE